MKQREERVNIYTLGKPAIFNLMSISNEIPQNPRGGGDRVTNDCASGWRSIYPPFTPGYTSVAMAHLSLDVCARKKVSTSSRECQEWMDKGVTQMYGFNHEDAIRCFRKALDIDSTCAMAHYYIARNSAPNYNNPAGLDVALAYEESQKATKLAQEVSLIDWEAALIKALTSLFTGDDSKSILTESCKKFACAMREVYQQFSEDVDVAALFAESLMMLAPWNLWTPQPDIKPAIPETEELVAVLEKSLQLEPTHPALCHFYIHTMELSANPEKALSAANVLRTRVPGQGHLLHMPSHIDMWLGHYEDAVESNKSAIDADEVYVTQTGYDNEFYKVYRMHNYHFGAWAAMFNGQFATALKFAEAAERQLGPEAVTCPVSDVGQTILEGFASIPWHVLVRFGRWEDIIRRPVKEDQELYPAVTAVTHYARGVALAALGRLDEAEVERQKFRKAFQHKSLERKYLVHNPLRNMKNHCGILDVAEAVLDGEVEYHKGNYELAYEHLRLAVKRDIGLSYDEPWGWMMPARHSLGALLLEQGHAAEAEEVYREDLLVYKSNMWALCGLHQALSQQNKTEEAKSVYAVFEVASSRADVKIGASCYCATKSVNK